MEFVHEAGGVSHFTVAGSGVSCKAIGLVFFRGSRNFVQIKNLQDLRNKKFDMNSISKYEILNMFSIE
jgi:hypothetical protein